MIEFAREEAKKNTASIKVIGLGGAGGNTINSIVASGCQGIEFIAVNTDAQALDLSKAHHKVHIGVKSTKGLGTGANPELGKRAAEEDLDKIIAAVGDADIVFLTAGMGGGTGSGALPVVAQALKEQGVLSIAVVTKPFLFEGKRRAHVAAGALDIVKKSVDTLIVIPNQKLLEIVDPGMSMMSAFSMINTVLSDSVKGISDIITKPGHINVDFADVRAIMRDMGLAVMGSGKASGPHRAQEAALQAITSPLLENMSIDGARGVLLNITGGENLGLHEISAAATIIYERADQDANIILGSVVDPSMKDEVSITIIATGFTHKAPETALAQEIKAAVQTPEVQKQQPAVAAAQNAEQTVVKVASLDVSAPKAEELKSATLDQEQIELEKMMQEDRAQEALMKTSATADSLDLDDMDIPTFMRKKAQEAIKSE